MSAKDRSTKSIQLSEWSFVHQERDLELAEHQLGIRDVLNIHESVIETGVALGEFRFDREFVIFGKRSPAWPVWPDE